jgi:DNA-binding transcriptional LysR family regulator
MDTRFLESFLTVVEAGSMAEAARRLGVTPAAVAQRIQALEQEIGTQLLSRAGRTVRPTEAGTAILARSRQVVREVRELRAFAAGEKLAGEIRLGAISTALTGLLPRLLMQLVSEAPLVDFYVVPGTSIELYRKVVEGDLDAAILVKPQFSLPKAYEWHLLRTEPLVVIGPEASAGSDPHELLRSRPFIRYDRNHWGGRLADSYLRQAGIRPQERLELDALEAIAVMVDKGDFQAGPARHSAGPPHRTDVVSHLSQNPLDPGPAYGSRMIASFGVEAQPSLMGWASTKSLLEP